MKSSSERTSAEREALVDDLARRQHGLVTRSQLLEAGAASTWIDGRVRRRRFRPIHRGVYLVGPMRAPRTREMAAVLASGRGAVVSHWSAGAIWGLSAPQSEDAPVHVLVPGTDRGRRPGIHPHRTAPLEPDEVADFQGIRVTTPPRTLLDLAGLSTAGELLRTLARAERRELLHRSELRRVVNRHPKRRGVGVLRRFLEEGVERGFTRSRAEELFLDLVRRARLPKPAVNVPIRGFEVDFLWRSRRLVAEVDGFAFHSSRRAFEDDRRRDAELTAAGFQVLRITWRQLKGEPEAVLARLSQALVQAPGTRSR